MMLVLSRSYVGSLLIAAHFRASSSSSTRLLLLEPKNTSSIFQLLLLNLLPMLLCLVLLLGFQLRALSKPSIFLDASSSFSFSFPSQ
ncbi:hypothetical protein E1A91_D07G111500v1 [Gossypium mustelinum]|uniref:Uncharacterized protein n=1 Tax=Gossypium mustelinum TaxID=34275 RepID=A0A5D2U9A7_GOSMU|nr:hypothetical protein E1A91_D07G111500v1 [Gossypium mustelinum]